MRGRQEVSQLPRMSLILIVARTDEEREFSEFCSPSRDLDAASLRLLPNRAGATGDKHSRSKICLPIRAASSAPRTAILASQESRGLISRDPHTDPAWDADQSTSIPGRPFPNAALCERPVQGGKDSRNLICPGTGAGPTPDPPDRWRRVHDPSRGSAASAKALPSSAEQCSQLEYCRTPQSDSPFEFAG
jgi:hypothetical protein